MEIDIGVVGVDARVATVALVVAETAGANDIAGLSAGSCTGVFCCGACTAGCSGWGCCTGKVSNCSLPSESLINCWPVKIFLN